MGKLTVFESVTLDGVMQAPGRPDEDTRGGFEHGGWAAPYTDPEMAQRIAADMAAGKGQSSLLLGRRTYEDFASFWPTAPKEIPFTEGINSMQKYVVSTTLREPLDWQNSTLVTGDVMKAVASLKEEQGLVVLGSGELVRSLRRHDLVDTVVLLIHPLILGSGRRLFDEGSREALQLVDSSRTATGVLMATYAAGDR